MLDWVRPARPSSYVLCGAEKLRGDILDRLIDSCEATSTGLVLIYRSIPPHVKERLAYYKVPSRWLTQTEPLPRNAGGKLDRAEVLRRLRGTGRVGGTA